MLFVLPKKKTSQGYYYFLIFYVKSNWDPPVQPSVAQETYLEKVKQQIAEIKIAKLNQNLPRKELQALNAIKRPSDLNLK